MLVKCRWHIKSRFYPSKQMYHCKTDKVTIPTKNALQYKSINYWGFNMLITKCVPRVSILILPWRQVSDLVHLGCSHQKHGREYFQLPGCRLLCLSGKDKYYNYSWFHDFSFLASDFYATESENPLPFSQENDGYADSSKYTDQRLETDGEEIHNAKPETERDLQGTRKMSPLKKREAAKLLTTSCCSIGCSERDISSLC